MFALSGCMFPLGLGALGTSLLFSSYNIAVSRNPDESDNLFNTTLMGYALVETFIFLSFIISGIVYIV
jgi:F0F1-type ATP synthase membrane subunit c/vacuolar-type H+-ATPase subunit K